MSLLSSYKKLTITLVDNVTELATVTPTNTLKSKYVYENISEPQAAYVIPRSAIPFGMYSMTLTGDTSDPVEIAVPNTVVNEEIRLDTDLINAYMVLQDSVINSDGTDHYDGISSILPGFDSHDFNSQEYFTALTYASTSVSTAEMNDKVTSITKIITYDDGTTTSEQAELKIALYYSGSTRSIADKSLVKLAHGDVYRDGVDMNKLQIYMYTRLMDSNDLLQLNIPTDNEFTSIGSFTKMISHKPEYMDINEYGYGPDDSVWDTSIEYDDNYLDERRYKGDNGTNHDAIIQIVDGMESAFSQAVQSVASTGNYHTRVSNTFQSMFNEIIAHTRAANDNGNHVLAKTLSNTELYQSRQAYIYLDSKYSYTTANKGLTLYRAANVSTRSNVLIHLEDFTDTDNWSKVGTVPVLTNNTRPPGDQIVYEVPSIESMAKVRIETTQGMVQSTLTGEVNSNSLIYNFDLAEYYSSFNVETVELIATDRMYIDKKYVLTNGTHDITGLRVLGIGTASITIENLNIGDYTIDCVVIY